MALSLAGMGTSMNDPVHADWLYFIMEFAAPLRSENWILNKNRFFFRFFLTLSSGSSVLHSFRALLGQKAVSVWLVYMDIVASVRLFVS